MEQQKASPILLFQGYAFYVNLFVDPTNTRAIALYRRVGFIESGEQDQMLEMRIDLTS
ncbi:MAG: hypothetical protein M3Z08_09275 [Chloroflexota bacterium]|nr:hypothetical protein [Chloroflexota bacterium]